MLSAISWTCLNPCFKLKQVLLWRDMRTALIIGASAGLGIEFARLFARDGHNVILTARRRDRMEALAKELLPAQVQVVDMDLGEAGAGQRLFEAVQSYQIDFLVNNAGFGSNGNFEDLDLANELKIIDLNVLSQALSEELSGTGVTCTVLAPGATVTEFAKTAHLENSELFRSGAANAATVALEGYQAMMGGKTIVISGLRNKPWSKRNGWRPAPSSERSLDD